MIRPNFEKWNQTAEDMRRLSITAAHPRSRERFQALYMIGTNKNKRSWVGSMTTMKLDPIVSLTSTRGDGQAN